MGTTSKGLGVPQAKGVGIPQAKGVWGTTSNGGKGTTVNGEKGKVSQFYKYFGLVNNVCFLTLIKHTLYFFINIKT